MIDLFSSQFEFFIKNKREGRTTIYGKILSICIILASLSFFIVLLTKLNHNDLLPKIVKITEIEDHMNEIEFDISPISFSVFLNKQKVQNLEEF